MVTLQCFHWWLFPAMLLLNMCGSLDAVLRFPIVHGFSELFPWKQLLLLFAKAALYCYSDCNVSQNRFPLVAVIALNILGLPLMYLFALPISDECSPRVSSMARDVVDEDVVVRLARFVVDCR